MSGVNRDSENSAERLSLLTERERQLLRLAAQHGSSKRIARDLGIEPASVDTALYRVCGKLGVKGRTAAVALLLRHDQPTSRNLDTFSPPPNESRSRPVADQASYPLSDEREPVSPALFEESLAFGTEPPSITRTLRRLLLEPGGRRDLTLAQQLRAVAFWTLAGLIILCLVGIILAEVGRAWASS